MSLSLRALAPCPLSALAGTVAPAALVLSIAGCAQGSDDIFGSGAGGDSTDQVAGAGGGGGQGQGNAGGIGYCGDAVCADTESCAACEADCGACDDPCGDGTCSAEETCTTCSADCGECPAGCDADGVCDPGETCANCAADCCGGATCGDGTCVAPETCSTCAADCGSCCGNGICDPGENQVTCALDCGGGGGTCAHSPCDIGVALDPACDPCVASICASDPFCCSVEWDDFCQISGFFTCPCI
jgi:hypothetical protein